MLTISASKQTVQDENNITVKSLYYLTISNGTDEIKLNVGQKTYEGVKKLNEPKPKK